VKEATVGYGTLRRLECSNIGVSSLLPRSFRSLSHNHRLPYSVKSLYFALAYYGRPHECLSCISRVPNFPDDQNHTSISTPTPASTRSALLTLMPGGSITDASSSLPGSFASHLSASIAEVRDGLGP
jgi:hypothetical protein